MILVTILMWNILALEITACKPKNDICPVATLSVKEQKQLELELLSMLGLPKRPENMSNKKLKYSSLFLLDLYKVLNDEKRESNRVKRGISFPQGLREDEVSKADLSDVVVSLNSVNKKSDGVGKRQKLAFVTQSLPKSAQGLYGAELKLYQNKKLVQILPYSMFTISVYKLSHLDSTKLKKVGEKITSTEYTGWLSIDISYVFNDWLENITSTKEIFISVKPYGIAHAKEIHPASVGIIFQHEQNQNEPFIVAFLKAENKVKPRLPRDTLAQPKVTELFNLLMERDACNIHSLKILFKDLGWNDWVIAPEGYATAFCHGECTFPIKFPRVATNHAIVQSLVQLKFPDQFPKPSCAPTKLYPLTVLYRDTHSNTILKKYRNMIAASCGCH